MSTVFGYMFMFFGFGAAVTLIAARFRKDQLEEGESFSWALVGTSVVLGGIGAIIAFLRPGTALTVALLVVLAVWVTLAYLSALRWSPAQRKTRNPRAITMNSVFTVVAVVIGIAIGSMTVVDGISSMNQALPVHFDGTTVKSERDGRIVLAALPNGTGTGNAQAEYKQDLRANPDSNFVIEGLLTNEQIATLPPEQQVEVAKNALVAHARGNVFLLTSSAKNAGLWDRDINDVSSLLTPADANGIQYLAQEGRDLHMRFADFVYASQGSIEDVDPNSVNTGFSEGGVSSSQGVSGNLKALVLRKDGKTVKVLLRCGNPVFAPDTTPAPLGHTDEQPPRPEVPVVPPTTGTGGPPPSTSTTPPTSTPPTTTPPTTTPPTTTPPTETCPPGSPGEWPNCDEKDQSAGPTTPSGHPTAPAPSGPAETTTPSETPDAPITETPRSEVPTPEPTVAPEPTNPGTTIPDPDGGDSVPAAPADTGSGGDDAPVPAPQPEQTQTPAQAPATEADTTTPTAESHDEIELSAFKSGSNTQKNSLAGGCVAAFLVLVLIGSGLVRKRQ